MIQESLRTSFPEFVEDLRTQSKTQQTLGRVAMVDFQDGKGTMIKQFNNLEGLQSLFDKKNKREGIAGSNEVIRRLYVLEDPGRVNVEVIGSQLGIPPVFFCSTLDTPKPKFVNCLPVHTHTKFS
jgi:hypothetical protein